MARTGQPASRQVASVQRAVAILNELAYAESELGTNEIARRTGINVSTISRILSTLASGGLVEHVPATGRYRLGLGILRLANAVHERLDIRALARPHLAELASRTRETATLRTESGLCTKSSVTASCSPGTDSVAVSLVRLASSARCGRASARMSRRSCTAFASRRMPRPSR